MQNPASPSADLRGRFSIARLLALFLVLWCVLLGAQAAALLWADRAVSQFNAEQSRAAR